MASSDKSSQSHVEALEPSSELAPEPSLKTVDTKHKDEAMKVFADYNGDTTWTKEEEGRLVKKIDRRLLVILVLTFAIQFYDKFIFSHAAIFGMRQDLNLTFGNRYSMASSIFYLGYIVGAYPATYLAQKFPIHRVVFSLVLLWGIDVLGGGFCRTWQELYAQRFMLGLLESGVSPVWMMVVGGWYTKPEQALRNGIWFAAAAMTTIPAPVINFGLGHIRGSLSPWRYMFIFAGSLTIIWAFVILFCMDPDPVSARHLNERERFIAVSRMRQNNAGVRNTHFKKLQVWEALTSAKFWLCFGISAAFNTVSAVTTTFTPLIINVGLGYTGLNSLLLTIPTGVVGTVVTIGISWMLQRHSSRSWRVWAMAACLVCCMLPCLLIWQVPRMQNAGKLICLYLLAFQPAGYAILMSISIANTAGYTKRSVSSAGLFIGYCVGYFVSPLMFLEREIPSYTTGWTFVVCCLAASILFSLVYRIICVRQNRVKDESGFTESFENAFIDDLTDKKNMSFRYVY